MKKSNKALLGLAFTLIAGMVFTGFILKKEAALIDLNNPARNYLTERIPAFKVLKISGSNGYPIEIEQSPANSLSVLRRRKGFLKTKVNGDTLEVVFSGANISREEAGKTKTPAGVVIRCHAVNQIIVANTYQRLKNFRSNKLEVRLVGNSAIDFLDGQYSHLKVTASNNSQFRFMGQNSADTLRIGLANSTVAYLQNIRFAVLQHNLSDSAVVVLTNQSLAQLQPFSKNK